MNLPSKNSLKSREEIHAKALIACNRLAPIWSLDKSIAVNPWWEMRDLTMSEVAAKMQTLGGVNLLMPKQYYKSLWQTQIEAHHLAFAIEQSELKFSEQKLVAYLDTPDEHGRWLNISNLLDSTSRHDNKIPWREEVVHQISQFTALYFQYPERLQYSKDAENGFYQAWLGVVQQDKGIEVLMSESGLNGHFFTLPNLADEVLAQVYAEFFAQDASQQAFIDYCHALLIDVHGWASWIAHHAWQDRLQSKNNSLLIQLLAVRMAWDWVLFQQVKQYAPIKFNSIRLEFNKQIRGLRDLENKWKVQQKLLWIWQRALEYSYQEPLNKQLLNSKPAEAVPVALQAIFCIDVRSEPIRRALEAQSPSIQTSGFAGFFGLPLEISISAGKLTRPQLPGLLKASVQATQKTDGMPNPADRGQAGSRHIYRQVAEKQSSDAAPSGFGMVEGKGLYRAASLIKNTLFPGKPMQSIEQIASTGPWELRRDGRLLTSAELANLAAGILSAMELRKNFPPWVLLVGHASSSTNNPHAAGLNCGACGGQSGEINAKIFAQILNDAAVRLELDQLGIHIPAITKFVAALHNTTTDELLYFDITPAPPWQSWLRNATITAQQNRAHALGIVLKENVPLDRAFQKRASDWAQLRPEWGLANNAALIVAPRSFTRHIDLAGRSFLHDYTYQEDVEFKVLELIMTAPMVVANWINLQYYASVTDNAKYGSGNKLLHNVVGGNFGVFEGNGGDLRTGLPMQSVHDDRTWRHQPLRLSVYIAAPRDAIADVVAKHQTVADLIDNDWLYLYQWDAVRNQLWQLHTGRWQPVKSEFTLVDAIVPAKPMPATVPYMV